MAGNSSTLTDMVLGAVARARVSIRTVFNLSVKMVAAPSVLRAHPSGTDTVNSPVGGVNATNAWLSGMSPAGLLSGVGAAAVLLLRVADPDGAVPLVPHPTSTAAAAKTAATPDTLRAGLLMASFQSPSRPAAMRVSRFTRPAPYVVTAGVSPGDGAARGTPCWPALACRAPNTVAPMVTNTAARIDPAATSVSQ